MRDPVIGAAAQVGGVRGPFRGPRIYDEGVTK
jgi:hypothetical protein